MSTHEPGGYPSPLPVMTTLLVSALLAALGIIMIARSKVPAVGGVFLVIGILGAGYGVLLALRNVRAARAIARTGQDTDHDDHDDRTDGADG